MLDEKDAIETGLQGIDAKHIDINICQLIYELIKF